MMIKDNFVMQGIADEYIVVPVAEEANRLRGVIQLNESGAYLWEKMSGANRTEAELASLLADKFGISIDMAKEDVSEFISNLRKMECIAI